MNKRHRSSLGDEIYEEILSDLISLKISPGSRITIDNLARELDVSQTPIRSALIRLESEGLVEKKHNFGYTAAAIPTEKEFKDIYEMRFLLEAHTASAAAENPKECFINQLISLNNEMRELAKDVRKYNYSKFAKKDAEFHSLIAEQSGNKIIMDTLKKLYVHIHIFRSRSNPYTTNEAVTEHQIIIDEIVKKSSLDAKQAMIDHINKSSDRLITEN